MLVIVGEVPVHGTHRQLCIRGMHRTGARHGRYPSVLAAAFDAFVGVLVKRREVFPELLVFMGDPVAWANGGELLCEVSKGCGVKLVLVRLHDCQRSHCKIIKRLHYLQVP